LEQPAARGGLGMNTHTIEVLRETTLARAAAVRRLDTRTMIPPRFSDRLSPICPRQFEKVARRTGRFPQLAHP
jgi:hypothetical protein